MICLRQLCLCSIMPNCLQMRGIEDYANRHRRHTLTALAANAQQQVAAKLVRQTARRSQSIFGMAGRSRSTLLIDLPGSEAMEGSVQPLAANFGDKLAGFQGQVSPRSDQHALMHASGFGFVRAMTMSSVQVAKCVQCAGPDV